MEMAMFLVRMGCTLSRDGFLLKGVGICDYWDPVIMLT
jgi:hypothetical protein